MSAATESVSESSTKPITGDLRDWFGERTLVALTLESVCCEHRGSRTGLLESDLLTLLCYCYASGIYGSHDIEVAAVHDPTIRRLCGNACPDWTTIRNFRRRNRACLLRTLQRLFASAQELRSGTESVGSCPKSEESSAANAVAEGWAVGLTTAVNRIDQAIHLDSMMMDE